MHIILTFCYIVFKILTKKVILLYKIIDINDIKFNSITPQDLVLALDRLTRFKHPEVKYNRVFTDLILKYLLQPRLSKKDVELLEFSHIKKIIEKIWNDSVFKYSDVEPNFDYNALLLKEAVATYNLNNDTRDLLDIKININAVLSLINDYDSAPINLKRLIRFSKSDELLNIRKKYALGFPVEKVVLCEGITEEILLPQFSKLAKFDFDKEGVKLISAGGKNKVAKLYCKMKDELKIPIFILLDADALETKTLIQDILRDKDEIYLIKNGEFEDIFSLNHIKRAINVRYKNICECTKIDLKNTHKMTKTLSEFYRVHELGDFQKADFAKELVENLKYKTDLTPEILEIINKIKAL